MVEIFKKFKPYVAVCLLVQSVSLVVLFFMLCRKKQGLANTVLALAALSGAVGGALFWQEYGEALGLRTSGEGEDGTLDFSDMELDIDTDAVNAELDRDDGEAAEDEPQTSDVLSEESSEDDFKGI